MADKLIEPNELEADKLAEVMESTDEELLEASDEKSLESNQDTEVNAHYNEIKNSVISGIGMSTFNQLTKKNQQYLLSVEKQIGVTNVASTTLSAIFNEIADTLIQGQKTGQTAKHLYGTPTECANIIKEQHFPKESKEDETPSEPWKIALDGALLLGSIYTLMTGLSLFTAKNPGAPGIGLLTLIVNYVVAGFAMLLISKNLPSPDAPKGEKGYFRYFGYSTLAMIGWVAAVSLVTAFVPPIINPVLPPVALIIIGLVTILARFYIKKQLNIKGGVF